MTVATFVEISFGTEATLKAEFTNTETGALGDPITVTGQIISPAGAFITLSVTRLSEGVYQALYLPTAPGRWEFRFAGVGRINAAEEGVLWVKNSDFI